MSWQCRCHQSKRGRMLASWFFCRQRVQLVERIASVDRSWQLLGTLAPVGMPVALVARTLAVALGIERVPGCIRVLQRTLLRTLVPLLERSGVEERGMLEQVRIWERERTLVRELERSGP